MRGTGETVAWVLCPRFRKLGKGSEKPGKPLLGGEASAQSSARCIRDGLEVAWSLSESGQVAKGA